MYESTQNHDNSTGLDFVGGSRVDGDKESG